MKYRLIVFDIDGTITRHKSSWQYIHEHLGIWNSEASVYQKRFKNGEIGYSEYCELDAQHWKGLSVKGIRDLFSEIKYMPNAKESLIALKNMGFFLAGLSSGLQYIPERINSDIGFDYMLTNALIDDGDVLTGKVDINVVDGKKGAGLAIICNYLGIPIENTIYIGDNDCDIECAKNAGFSIAFNHFGANLADFVGYSCKTIDFKEVFGIILNENSVKSGKI
ncbi:MAG: HAD-IB family phosphatase [Elusimicrobiota bacterium]